MSKKELEEKIKQLEEELRETTRKYEILVARVEGKIGMGGFRNPKA